MLTGHSVLSRFKVQPTGGVRPNAKKTETPSHGGGYALSHAFSFRYRRLYRNNDCRSS
jgi:hypothetical protein